LVYQFNLSGDIQYFLNKDGHIFYWMLFAGFMAENAGSWVWDMA
jgi:hypothetical protein